MTLRSLALATLLLVGAASPARADVTLYTSFADSGSGSFLRCTAVNTGKKAISPLVVTLVDVTGGQTSANTCFAVDQDEGCVTNKAGPLLAYCKITYNGSKKAVRGALLVRDADANSVLSVEAR